MQIKTPTLFLIFFFFISITLKSQELTENNAVNYSKKAFLYYNSNDYDSAIVFINKAIDIYSNSNNEDSLAKCYITVSTIYGAISDYDLSTEFAYKALTIYEKTQSNKGLAICYINFGSINSALKKYDTAINYNMQAFALLENTKNYALIIRTLNNLGATYAILENFEDALKKYYIAIDYCKKSNNKKFEAYILGNISLIFREKKEFKEALKVAFEALNIFNEINFSYGISDECQNIASIYFKQQKYEKAIYFYLKSNEVAQKINKKSTISNNYQHLAEGFAYLKQFDKAFEYQKLYTQTHDSIFNEESNKQMLDILTKYETEKKEKENQILRHKQKLKNLWIIVLITAFILTIPITLIFYIQKKQKTNAYNIIVKRNIELVESEKIIREARTELEAIIENKNTKNEQSKYVFSDLTTEKKEDILKEISQVFENEKIYCDIDFTMLRLAEKINTNKNYISQVINEKCNTNFSNFVNGYRIKEARRLLSDNKNNYLTIHAIANMVGFKSKTSFNNAFKKFIGVTPSFFIKSLNKNSNF